MHFFTAFTTACLFGSVLSTPIVDPKDQSLEPRQGAAYITWWAQENYSPTGKFWQLTEPADRRGKGDCQGLGNLEDVIRSAKAPSGWKCTFYQHSNCQGWRTREFNSGGIGSLGAKMAGRASAFRCCQIGQTNYWGLCSATLNGGS